MIRNYLKVAMRYLQRNKLYAFVNIAGLAIGIAGCLLIGVYIWHEWSYDRFHQHANRIARVTWEYDFGDAQTRTANTGTKVGPQLQRSFPEVADYVRTFKGARVLSYGGKVFEEKNFFYADAAFFRMFSFSLLRGDAATVLDAPDKMVITQTAAQKLFGNTDPVGKSVKVGATKEFLITGVAADAPANSQIQFDFVASFTSLAAAKEEKWSEANFVTYLLLRDEKQIGALQRKVDAYARRVAREEMNAVGVNYMTFHLEPLKRVHLYSDLEGFEPNNNITYIYILGAVALLILLIACVNYTNLSTAQSAGRSTEVGIRKVLGARKRQVFSQFISESFVLAVMAMVLALLLSVVLLPFFNQVAGKSLSAAILVHPATLCGLLLLVLVITATAGAYPSLVLSGGRLTQILKSGFRLSGSNGLRKSLIVLQFSISIFLMIGTIVILQQLAYMRNKDLGYNKEQVVVLPLDGKMDVYYDDLKKALSAHTSIASVGGAYEPPTNIGWSDGLRKGVDDKESITVNALPVDQDFVKTLGLNIVAGADYSLTDVQQFDTSNEGRNLRYAYMLNETAAKALGWTPQEAVGKTIAKGREGTVKAVVKDFHFRSLHQSIGPLVIFMDQRMVNNLFVKIRGNTPAALAHLRQVWKERVTHRPFTYSFLDETYDALYKTEQRMAGVFTTFAILAILLASLGLFALTAYIMVQRTKEIGIRKVLGATIGDILSLVSKDFVKLVLVAMLVAMPSVWLAVNKWLQAFSYRTPLQWWVFPATGIAVLLLALVTIGLQAIKTALSNPIKNLRTE